MFEMETVLELLGEFKASGEAGETNNDSELENTGFLWDRVGLLWRGWETF